jgi:hypothetical protein
MTIKLNSHGDVAWESNDAGASVAIDSEMNVYLCGSFTTSRADKDVVTTKLRPDGSRIWQHVFDGPNNTDDRVAQMLFAEGDGIYVVYTGVASASAWQAIGDVSAFKLREYGRTKPSRVRGNVKR